MPARDETFLVDLLDAAHLIHQFVTGMTQAAFEQDLMRQSAVMRQLEILGEAAKRISDPFRLAHPDIPWRQMTGMRDILIHAYNHVDIAIVWNAAAISIPALIKQLEFLVSQEDHAAHKEKDGKFESSPDSP